MGHLRFDAGCGGRPPRTPSVRGAVGAKELAASNATPIIAEQREVFKGRSDLFVLTRRIRHGGLLACG